ncbi:MAG: GntR family transcriptional regulator [Thermocladium sp.]|jgi:DNA-binding GntR family transcriptional regulator
MRASSIRIYDELVDNIVKGKFKPGTVLKEDELASLFNVSRTPIREALIRLEREGIAIKSGKSYIIIPLTGNDVLMLYEARAPLEAYAAKLAASRATSVEINEMASIIEQVKKESLKDDPDPVLLADLNGEFHDLIAKSSQNKYIGEMLNSIRLKLKIVRVTLFSSYQRRTDELREHEAIFEAIRDRKPDDAFNNALNHVYSVAEYVKTNVLPLLF